jgi:pimeloyl-ACP methyl ester carboxylesterase
LITAYSNLADAAFAHYPVYPIKMMLRNNFTPDKWLAHYTGPVTIIDAGKDQIIPNRLGQKLYDGIPSAQKKITIIENVDHNTIYQSKDFFAFLGSVLK